MIRKYRFKQILLGGYCDFSLATCPKTTIKRDMPPLPWQPSVPNDSYSTVPVNGRV